MLRHPKALKDLSPAELASRLDAGDSLRLVDVRRPYEYRRGHIAAAASVPLGSERRSLRDLPRETPVVLICLSGHRSQVAAANLLEMGFGDVSHLDGGMLAWWRARLPVSR
jgi:rhodanese-related sulfurtransferase